MGSCRTLIDTNRSAVRATGAAHRYPLFNGSPLPTSSRRTEGQEPLTLEPPG